MKHKLLEHTCLDCNKKFTTTTDCTVQKCSDCHTPTERDEMFIKMLLGRGCKRCDHTWTLRNLKEPTICPKCKSPYWNKERKATT